MLTRASSDLGLIKHFPLQVQPNWPHRPAICQHGLFATPLAFIGIGKEMDHLRAAPEPDSNKPGKEKRQVTRRPTLHDYAA